MYLWPFLSFPLQDTADKLVRVKYKLFQIGTKEDSTVTIVTLSRDVFGCHSLDVSTQEQRMTRKREREYVKSRREDMLVCK